jgi:hypothetical protein
MQTQRPNSLQKGDLMPHNDREELLSQVGDMVLWILNQHAKGSFYGGFSELKPPPCSCCFTIHVWHINGEQKEAFEINITRSNFA